MCGMNLAFDRKLIGPAMYFGLMGQGQPWGRYDDMWAGWCCKVPPPSWFQPWPACTFCCVAAVVAAHAGRFVLRVCPP